MIILESLRNLLSRPATRNFPKRQPQIPDGSHGKVKHLPDKCIYCMMCARNCPAWAITVNPPKRQWSYDPGRCVFCGECEEICREVVKRGAIVLTKEWDLSSEKRPQVERTESRMEPKMKMKLRVK
jgi:formate hydrogenlyase subunit 6/NADH:ubiquinone oxidoreductase subunit I